VLSHVPQPLHGLRILVVEPMETRGPLPAREESQH
jgi:hypothetical protein